jgi:hypothetical protein
MNDETAAVEQTPAESDRDALGAIYDKLTAESPIEETQPTPADAAKPEVAAVEAAPAVEEPPTDIPAAVRQHWATIPKEARDAFLSSQRESGRKLAESGRLVSGVKPVVDVLHRAVKEIPGLQQMKPEQVAHDVFEGAKMVAAIRQNPVANIINLAKQHGAFDALKAHLAGQPAQQADQSQAMAREIRELKQQLSQVSDPGRTANAVSQILAERETQNFVTGFAAERAENWAVVEPFIPNMIPLAKQRLGANASAKDVLTEAYEMAIHAHPDLRAKMQAAAQAPAVSDPARLAAQRAAKSVNVTSQPGKPQPATERAAMGAVWDKYRS